VHATSRDPNTHLTGLPCDCHVRFDLNDPTTWAHLPCEGALLWCFPAAPLEQVQHFAASLTAVPRKLVVLGSTSAYDGPHRSDEYPPPWMDESAPIDLTKPRVQGEEFLRRHHGAIVLRVAGIYGPGRNPVDWIKQGRVTASRKYVNLIHVEDLATACLAALEHGIPGTTYNVSDGQPRTWDELCRAAADHWHIPAGLRDNGPTVGKRISNTRLLALLETGGERLRHPDLMQALKQLQSMRAIPSAGS